MVFSFVSHVVIRMTFFFNDTVTTEIYTLSLHDALPILGDHGLEPAFVEDRHGFHGLHVPGRGCRPGTGLGDQGRHGGRSEEHTSELQSRENLVCRLLLEKKKKKYKS